MTLQELTTIIRKHMLLAANGESIIKLLAAFLVASKLPIKPPWLFIVAGSSGGKSRILQMLEGVKDVICRDDLTASTFVSGYKTSTGESASLIDNMADNTVLIVKDLTVIMSKDQEERAKVLGIMRKLYDGDFEKSYGNNLHIKWQGKFSFLAGTTTKIHTTLYKFADVGERYLLFKFEQPDRKEATRMSLQESEMADLRAEAEMQTAFTQYFNSLTIPDTLPKVETKIKDEIVDLAELVTRARSAVERDERDREKTIIQVHDMEMPMRFAKQVMALVYGYVVLNGEPRLSDEDRKTIHQLALDCIPSIRRLALRKLVHYKKIATAGLAVAISLPTATVRRHLEDLAAHEVIKRIKSGNKDEWELMPHYREILAKFEGIKPTEEVLEEDAELDSKDEQLIEQAKMEEPEFMQDAQVQSALDIIGGTVV